MPADTAMVFSVNRDQDPDRRIADALEFIAHRMAGIEYNLSIIRGDLRAAASVLPKLVPPQT
jgi:hypothetical protein